MDHHAFIKTLSPETRLVLNRKSNIKGLRHLAAHWGLIPLVTGLILAKIPYWWLLLPLQGALLIFNFTLMHECTHETPFASKGLNKAIGWVCGFSLFLPFEWFRYFHFAHHKYTNDPAGDPELAGISKPETRLQYIFYISGLPVWLSQLKTLAVNAAGRCSDSFVPARARHRIQIESIIYVILYILIIFTSSDTLGRIANIWIIPIIIGQPLLRLFLLAEHGRCPDVRNMFANSRTTLTVKALRVLSWNMPYHAEHHSLPTVPFHNLPRLHSLAQAHLKVVEPSFAGFHKAYISSLK